MSTKNINSNGEQYNFDEPLFNINTNTNTNNNTNLSFNRYKYHLICFIIWIAIVCTMIGYYYLK